MELVEPRREFNRVVASNLARYSPPEGGKKRGRSPTALGLSDKDAFPSGGIRNRALCPVKKEALLVLRTHWKRKALLPCSPHFAPRCCEHPEALDKMTSALVHAYA